MRGVKTLLIDNYDSFTYNLYQYLYELNGIQPDVIKNDSMRWEELQQRLHLYDNIILSPGPGLPHVIDDFGLCHYLLEAKPRIPILGVCLGHQGLGLAFGGKVVHAPQVAHGVLCTIAHDDSLMFRGVSNPVNVVRYHSWIVDRETLPEDQFKITALTSDADRLIMGLEHKSLPYFGIQFHPESIMTDGGKQMLRNFMEFSCTFHGTQRSIPSAITAKPSEQIAY